MYGVTCFFEVVSTTLTSLLDFSLTTPPLSKKDPHAKSLLDCFSENSNQVDLFLGDFYGHTVLRPKMGIGLKWGVRHNAHYEA